jgi:hypothetical protein
MLNFRSAPSAENSSRSIHQDSYFSSITPAKPRSFTETPRGQVATLGSSPQPRHFVHRQLTPESGRALEILGHAIEYLADEYAADVEHKGPLGNADPRVAAIQILKGLNRGIYFSGTEVQPALGRIRRWFSEYLSSGP